ncbi:hypothetical protein ACFY0G_26675 [Streptomyces sp. NPDC001552]|uniref:hypothetical protein n=1 Tax=Streptomyces sp. NPDC001552 TaxID=3364587 RepID=UPI0036A1F0D8
MGEAVSMDPAGRARGLGEGLAQVPVPVLFAPPGGVNRVVVASRFRPVEAGVMAVEQLSAAHVDVRSSGQVAGREDEITSPG